MGKPREKRKYDKEFKEGAVKLVLVVFPRKNGHPKKLE